MTLIYAPLTLSLLWAHRKLQMHTITQTPTTRKEANKIFVWYKYIFPALPYYQDFSFADITSLQNHHTTFTHTRSYECPNFILLSIIIRSTQNIWKNTSAALFFLRLNRKKQNQDHEDFTNSTEDKMYIPDPIRVAPKYHDNGTYS